MDETVARDVIHKVNNLLAVIHTQVAMARAAGTLDGHVRALASIEATALSTRDVLRKAREAAGGA